MGRDGEELQAFCFPSSTRGKKINNKQLWGEMTATKGFPLRALCPLGGKRLSERRRCDVLILQFYCSHDFGREIRFGRGCGGVASCSPRVWGGSDPVSQ